MGELKRYGIKTFDELTITDDFMFGRVMSDPKNLKPLLELILHVKIARIEYPERQKTIETSPDHKGVRLDVYCEDDGKTVYAIEIQTSDEKNLPKRIRYYRDMIDINILDKGADYIELKKSFVIFICTFDYFKKDRYMYTFLSQCQEDGRLYLDDETTSIVLNVNGTVGDIDEELKGALRYMAGQAPSGSYAETLAAAVKEARTNEKWRRDYVSIALKFKEYEKIGMKIGEERGKKIGSLANTVSGIRNNKEEATEEQIIKFLRLDKVLYRKISEMIDANPDMSDWEIAETILADDEFND
ncbi:MAG: Rpn family recombination-promoting nuclease/putative transposase [Thermoguttaceae bacterium]|nr:Rpn family recombination-promoting nuclease/putative transposase [Thermoguttaceae bacterium]MBR5759512.1 Rpn family recombination-promoting nuclease/putative transposase [Thermoguttaceae bacterium]